MATILGIIFFAFATRSTIACYVEVNNIETACPYYSLTVTNWRGQFVNASNCGEKMKKIYFTVPPIVAYPEADRAATYTLQMLDPDVPIPFVGPVLLHWLVANIPGVDLALGDVSRGNILYDYVAPSPPPFSGNHRYMLMVYKEHSLSQKVAKPLTRNNFKQGKWMIRQKAALCGPVAGTMFLASH